MTSIDGFEILVSSPVFFWVMAGLAVLAVTISKSGFGGALGSLSLPLLLFVLPPKIALGVLLPLFLITDVWVVYIWRHMLDRRILMIMCGFGLLGQLLGWLLFDYLSDRLLT
ncbi:MAG: TSUP family transporter, partial [bacterium]